MINLFTSLHKHTALLLITLLWILIGCGNSTTQETEPTAEPVTETTEQGNISEGYPVLNTTDGYPVIEETDYELVGTLDVQPPSAETGTFAGKLVSQETALPVTGVPLTFVEIVRQNGEAAFVLDTFIAPYTMTTAEGDFHFNDVPPGEYIFMMGSPEGYYKFVMETEDDAQLFYVNANEATNAGTLTIPELDGYETK